MSNYTIASAIVMLPIIMGLITLVICIASGSKHTKVMLTAALMVATPAITLVVMQYMGMEPIYMVADIVGTLR